MVALKKKKISSVNLGKKIKISFGCTILLVHFDRVGPDNLSHDMTHIYQLYYSLQCVIRDPTCVKPL